MKQFWKRAAVAIVSLALLAGMPPAAGAASDEVEAALASMTLREKVGQLFAVRPEALDFEQRSGGMKLTCSMREHLRSYPVGGIVLFATNISSQSQMTALIRDFQRSAGNSLLVAVDEEGGPVARLANSSAFDLPKFPSASAIGTTGDPEQARTMGRTIGGYLKHYGFNLDLAPVADVNSNPLNPVIGRRAFSSDPDVTAGMVRAAVQGFHEAGMLCTLKHFPGHGDTLEDSHAGTATSTKTWEEMKAVELLPFEAGIAAGADVVMAAHITTPNATEDGLPASLSYTILTEQNSFFAKSRIRIIQCDDQVRMDEEVKNSRELEQLLNRFTVIGGGGTDFRPAFAYVNELLEQGVLKNLGGLLYFTDGKGIYPKKRPEYKTAFLFLDDYDESAVPPWAMRLRVEQEDILAEETRRNHEH